MATKRNLVLALIMAAALGLGAVAQAGLLPVGADVVTGTIASFDAASGKLLAGGRTLYVTPQTVIQKRVGDHFESATCGQLQAGEQVRASVQLVGDRFVVRQLDLLEKGPRKAAR